MDKVAEVKHIGKESCEHDFIKDRQLPAIIYFRVCKLCGRIEKVETIDDFIYYCNLFHGKEKVK
jgi:hypothetical protein